MVEGMENTNKERFLDWSLLATPERRSSDWLLEEMAPTPPPPRPIRVLIAVLDPGLRHTLAMTLRLDGHEVSESDDLVSPDECLAEGFADLVVCGALPADTRNGKPEELIVFSGRRVTQRTLIRDPQDLNRLRYLVHEHTDGLLEAS
jgi:hypothetical protein